MRQKFIALFFVTTLFLGNSMQCYASEIKLVKEAGSYIFAQDKLFTTADMEDVDAEKILNKIKDHPDVTEDRVAVIEEAMYYVGKLNYSQAHHLCRIDEPCNKDKDVICAKTDCSGFVSYLWRDYLFGEIENTNSLFDKYPEEAEKFNGQNALPGDILLRFNEDRTVNHALIWLGYHRLEEGEFYYSPVTIDCTTTSVFSGTQLQTKDWEYYEEAYVIHPDKYANEMEEFRWSK